MLLTYTADSCVAAGFIPQPQRLALRSPVGGRRIIGAQRQPPPRVARPLDEQHLADQFRRIGRTLPEAERKGIRRANREWSAAPGLIGLRIEDARDAARAVNARVILDDGPLGPSGIVSQRPAQGQSVGPSGRRITVR